MKSKNHIIADGLCALIGEARSIVCFDKKGKGDVVVNRWDGILVGNGRDIEDGGISYISLNDLDKSIVFIKDDEITTVINFIKTIRNTQ